jgi:hypothetical protein
MRALLGAIAVAAWAGGASAQEPARDAKLPPPFYAGLEGFGWFAELAGSCWSGTRADGVTVDTQCYLPQYDRLVRGTIKTVAKGQTLFEGDAVFARHPSEARKIIYTQWGSGGAYATGEMVVEADTLTFHSRDPGGEPWANRHVWRRTGPDGFRVTRERKEESKWVEVLTQEYKRIPAR